VLPLAADRPAVASEFVAYLRELSSRADLIVVDASSPEVFAAHARYWGHWVRHAAPDRQTPNGKVGNVLTGLCMARHDRVVIADDDVRFGAELETLVACLDHADIIRPQNYFDPLPWHAVWDSGRMLLNRIAGGDWPGALAVRRPLVLAAGGYAGDVMFENYELAETVLAAGGRQMWAPEIFVRRLPPTARHFWSQRVRQAYDELARPHRLLVFLPVIPAMVALAVRRRRAAAGRRVAAGVVLVMTAAELGRRFHGGRRYFPARCSLAAPLWVTERAVCSWAALVARARGGVEYGGCRFRRAALTSRQRRRTIAARSAAICVATRIVG
jgi:hypothetical protein